MVKRLVFVAILALQLFAVTSVATADPPAAPVFTRRQDRSFSRSPRWPQPTAPGRAAFRVAVTSVTDVSRTGGWASVGWFFHEPSC